MRPWTDVGIAIPYGIAGEVRLTCPRCSASRRKSRVACLAVNVDKGTWVCWHCGWKGGLRRGVTVHRTYLTPDGRKADVPSPKKLMTQDMPGADWADLQEVAHV